MRKKILFFLLCWLLVLVLLSGCSGGQGTTVHSSNDSDDSSPEQSAQESYPEEDPIQEELPDLELNDDAVGEADLVPVIPQTPGMSVEQTEESSQPEDEPTAPNIEPDASPVPEISSGATESQESASGNMEMENPGSEEEITEMKMTVQVGADTFTATLESNTAVEELVELLESGPLTIQMSDYGGFEKVGNLGTSLPTSNIQTTTQTGDIVLYQGILYSTKAAKLSFSTALTPGAIPDWAGLMTLPVGQKLWAMERYR